MAANTINQLSTANTFQHWLQATESLISQVNLLTNGNGDSFFANTNLIVGGSAANVSLNVHTGASINVTTGNTINTINLESVSTVFTGNVTSKVEIPMQVGAGLYLRDEIVFQSPDETYGNAVATALVYGWNSSSKILQLVQVTGDFGPNTKTIGVTSSANWTTKDVTQGYTWARPNVAIPSNIHAGRDLYVDGDLVVSGNITLDTVGFDDLTVSGSGTFSNTLSVTGTTTLSNTLSVTGTTTLSNAVITGNVATLNVTSQASFGQNVLISGDLTVSGNIILDSVGYDDINANGSVSVGNNLTVTGITSLTGNVTAINERVTGTLEANILTGNANTQIYSSIAIAQQKSADDGLAFSIALG